MTAFSVLSLVNIDFSLQGSVFSSVIPFLSLAFDFIYCHMALGFSLWPLYLAGLDGQYP